MLQESADNYNARIRVITIGVVTRARARSLCNKRALSSRRFRVPSRNPRFRMYVICIREKRNGRKTRRDSAGALVICARIAWCSRVVVALQLKSSTIEKQSSLERERERLDKKKKMRQQTESDDSREGRRRFPVAFLSRVFFFLYQVTFDKSVHTRII